MIVLYSNGKQASNEIVVQMELITWTVLIAEPISEKVDVGSTNVVNVGDGGAANVGEKDSAVLPVEKDSWDSFI